MECQCLFLNCGFNSTGNSALLTFQKQIRSEIKVTNRVLINVGDSTQRFCQENRIKLSGVNYIFITSLAPHNISGFAGVFLALSDLGLGELHVIGPKGLKGYLDAILPFVNRKYPELKIEEIEETKSLRIKGAAVQLQPVFNHEEPRRIIAMAVKFVVLNDLSFSFENDIMTKPLIAVIPVGHYFATFPSTFELLSSSQDNAAPNSPEHNFSVLGYSVSRPLAIFVPIAVSSHFGHDQLHHEADESDNLCGNIANGDENGTGDIDKEEDDDGAGDDGDDILSPGKLALVDLKALTRKITSFSFVLPNILNCEDVVELRTLQRSLGIQYAKHLKSYPSELLNSKISLTGQKRGMESLSISGQSISGSYIPRLFPIPAIQRGIRSFIIYGSDGVVGLRRVYPGKGELLVAKPMTSILISSSGSMHVELESNVDRVLQDCQIQLLDDTDNLRDEAVLLSSVGGLSDINHHDLSNSSDIDSQTFDDGLNSGMFVPQSNSEEFPKPNMVDASPLASELDDKNHAVARSLRSKLIGLSKETQPIHVAQKPNPFSSSLKSLFSFRHQRKRVEIYSTTSNESAFNDSTTSKGSALNDSGKGLLTDSHLDNKLDLGECALLIQTEIDSPASGLATMTNLSLKPANSQFLEADSMLKKSKTDELGGKASEVGGNTVFSGSKFKPKLVLEVDDSVSSNIFPQYAEKESATFDRDFGDGFRINFLGTGCAAPSPHRANSAILLTLLSKKSQLSSCAPGSDSVSSSRRTKRSRPISQSRFSDDEEEDEQSEKSSAQSEEVNEDGPSVLLDCGESAACQLLQLVAGDVVQFDRLLLSLRIIWISHHHADHAAGIPMLLHHLRRAQMRRRRSLRVRSLRTALTRLVRAYPTQLWDKYRIRDGLSSPQIEPGRLLIIASEAVLRATEFSLSVAGLDDLVSFVPATNALYAGMTTDVQAVTDGRLMRLTAVPVQHCHSAFGAVLETVGGLKIVYSGDCRPSASLVRVGRNCDLLIHEATFGDDDIEEANKKKHSTFSEAVTIADKMGAKYVILTHFSRRYSKRPGQRTDCAIVDNIPLVLSPGLSTTDHTVEPHIFTQPMSNLFGRRQNFSLGATRKRGEQGTGESSSKENRPLIFAEDLLSFRFPSEFDQVAKLSKSPFVNN